MITTGKSPRCPTGLRVTAYLVLGLAVSATLVLAGDGSPMPATYILGLDGVAKNANGNISIQEDALQFRGREGRVAQMSLGSIVNVTLVTRISRWAA